MLVQRRDQAEAAAEKKAEEALALGDGETTKAGDTGKEKGDDNNDDVSGGEID